jgi:outer membrane protein W
MRKLWALPVLSALAIPAVASAEVGAQAEDITVQGSLLANNGPDFDGFTLSLQGQVEYFVTDAIGVRLTQTLGYTDVGVSGSALNGSTGIGGSWNFNLDQFVPYVACNIGYVYGDGSADSFYLAPEVGVKYYANETTFVFGSVSYQWFFDDADDVGSSVSDGQFVYAVGIGFEL